MKNNFYLIYFILFIISSIVIINQIALMQFLAYQQWYHFASMIISITLFGFGLSGLIISYINHKTEVEKLRLIKWIVLITSISFPLTLIINQKVVGQFDSILIFFDFIQVIKFFIMIFNFTITFTLLAIIIGLLFSTYSQRINKLYFWNLLGSSAGGVIVIIFLWNFLPQQILAINGLILSLIITLKFIENESAKGIKRILIIFSLLLNTILLAYPLEYRPSQFKSISRLKDFPDAQVKYDRKTPYGRVEIISSSAIRYSPGLSLNFTEVIPQANCVLVNGEVAGYELKNSEIIDNLFLTKSTLFLPFSLGKHENVLILNSNCGIEIFRAINGNVENIDITELNPIILDITRKQFINQKDVSINFNKVDPRIYIESTQKKYNLIFYPVIEPVGMSSGLYAVQEKFLLTKESFQKIYERLNSNGYFTISCYIDNPPKSYLKVLNLLINIRNEEDELVSRNQIVAINNWNVITFLLKKGVFNQNEIDNIKDFCEANQFDFTINPVQNISHEQYNIILEQSTINLIYSLLNRDKIATQNYLFNINEPSDDRPYFSNFIKIKNFNSYLKHISLRTLTYGELGYFLIWVSFGIVLFLSFLLLLAGFLKSKLSKKLSIQILIYFSLIGLAYMIVEISLIQKFTLIFSTDIFAITFIICLLLISSGVGSLLSMSLLRKIKYRIIIFSLIFLFGFILNLILISPEFIIKQNTLVKFLLATFLIFPLGFLMGIPFPQGIKMFTTLDKNSVPLLWAVNGSFSVIGSLGANVLLINIGFFTTFLIALLCYLLCGIFTFFNFSRV